MKKSLCALNVAMVESARAMRYLDAAAEVRDSLLLVVRKDRDRGKQTCQQVVKVFLDEEKRKDKKREEREAARAAGQKKEEKEEGASVLFGSKLIVSSEDASFGVFVDGKRLQADAKSVTVKDAWNGFKGVAFATFA